MNPRSLVSDSEYLETHLVAVPKSSDKEFRRSYETISPMVVPRSSNFITSDNEYGLYAVTTFKKHSGEFVHKCRERRWVPRDFKYKEGGKEEEEAEVDRVAGEERKQWGETLRLGRTGWSEGMMCWVHVIVLRVFVETVLRYGLPLDFVCGLVKVCRNLLPRIVAGLPAASCVSGDRGTKADVDVLRQVPSQPRGHALALTRHSPISRATQWEGTRKVDRPRTSRNRTCRQQVKGATVIILLTYATSSR